MENNIDLAKVRDYMDKSMSNMGSVFSHFTIEIWSTGRTRADGTGEETHYRLMIVSNNNIPASKLISTINAIGHDRLGGCIEVERFEMWRGFDYTPGDAFREAQTVGRNLYYALRKEYPIHRKLGYSD